MIGLGGINEMIQWYGIKTPETEFDNSIIMHVTKSIYTTWNDFFRYNAHNLPLEEAKRAYKSIGYKCVELEVKVKVKE